MRQFQKSLAVILVLIAIATLSAVELRRAPPAAAEEGELNWVIGKWEGTQGKGRWLDPTTFSFEQDGEKVKWMMERKSGRGSEFWEAAGTVVKAPKGSLEMEGKYTGGTSYSRWAGGVLRFWLNGTGDSLSGTAQGADGTTWNVSLIRKK